MICQEGIWRLILQVLSRLNGEVPNQEVIDDDGGRYLIGKGSSPISIQRSRKGIPPPLLPSSSFIFIFEQNEKSRRSITSLLFSLHPFYFIAVHITIPRSVIVTLLHNWYAFITLRVQYELPIQYNTCPPVPLFSCLKCPTQKGNLSAKTVHDLDI